MDISVVSTIHNGNCVYSSHSNDYRCHCHASYTSFPSPYSKDNPVPNLSLLYRSLFFCSKGRSEQSIRAGQETVSP